MNHGFHLFQKIADQDRRRLAVAGLCVMLAVFSFVWLAPYMESQERYPKTIASLDHKRDNVVSISAALLGTSVAVAAVPGDATTPIANQISELNSHLIIVLGAIILEKFLLTVIAMVVCRLLLPAAMVLAAVFLVWDRLGCLVTAVQIGVLSLALMLLIPGGVFVGDRIDFGGAYILRGWGVKVVGNRQGRGFRQRR